MVLGGARRGTTVRLAMLLAVTLAVALAVASVGACVGRPGPSPLPVAPPATTGVSHASAPKPCGDCHAEAQREWAGSMHQQAFVSRDFQLSWAREPLPFCAQCHAPQRDVLGAVGAHMGVSCIDCHAGAQRAHDGNAPRPGKVRDDVCVPCHDFAAPGSRAFLQATAREHAETRFAKTSCISCHMMARHAGEGHDHAFSVSRNVALLRRSIEVRSVQRAETGLRVTVQTRGVGHRFPTGDIFRKVTVAVLGLDQAGAVLCAETFAFHRNWDAHRRAIREGQVETLADDERLTDAPRQLAVPCAAPLLRLARARVVIDYARGLSADGDRFDVLEEQTLLDHEFAVPYASPMADAEREDR